jgi:hypothetical protein
VRGLLLLCSVPFCKLSPQAYSPRASKQTQPVGVLALEEGDESGRKEVPSKKVYLKSKRDRKLAQVRSYPF